MSSKVSQDLDCILVSNKNFSEILPSNDLGPGPGEVGQGILKVLHLWHHTQKIHTNHPKHFLNSSLLVLAPELHSCKAMCDPVVLVQKSSKQAGRQMLRLTSLSLP